MNDEEDKFKHSIMLGKFQRILFNPSVILENQLWSANLGEGKWLSQVGGGGVFFLILL